MPSLSAAGALQPVARLFTRLTMIAPREARVTVGLDVGSSSIKVLALGPRKGASARPIIGQRLVPLETGQDVDASEAVRAAVSVLRLPTRTVNLAVSGQWVVIRIIELPAMKPTELKQALPFEAQRYLPFNIQDVIVDGVVLGPSEGGKDWVLVVACKKDLLERRVDWVRRAGLSAAVVDVDALALANGYVAGANGYRVQGTRALINIGAQMTNLVIFRDQTPYLVRDIPWGGEKLIRGAADQLGADTAAVGQALRQNQLTSEMSSAVTLSSETLVTELQLSFDYFENHFGQPPEELFVSGGVGQSEGLVGALRSHLTQTIIPWAPVKGLSGQFAVAYGLALRSSA
jgi:type IV pilus assembly protein PilM